MTDGRKNEIEALFEAALERRAEERAGWLRAACGGDAELEAGVRRLLAAHERAEGILEGSAGDLAAELLGEAVGRGALAALGAGAGEGEAAWEAAWEALGGERVGERVGAWRLVEAIGRGGMGTVYRAERADGQFRQRVAVKILRRGLETQELVRRFVAERQILATLAHPNIARLLDGGVSADGRPYLVMELVEGESIERYCDARRLTIAERLRLFVVVCRAVHHAHKNLVVHRDLKPSNILVTNEGEVKLLDFGIAKLIGAGPDEDEDEEEGEGEGEGERGEGEGEGEGGGGGGAVGGGVGEVGVGRAAPLTRTGLRLLTPEYASPEQIRGEAVTTAADVYGLGLVLYELLCGRRPYGTRGRSWSEVERLVLEQEPPRPSVAVTREEGAEGRAGTGTGRLTPQAVGRARASEPGRLRRTLRGDLDRIVAKALRKEPERRYSSASQLADDLERFLAGEPVLAQGEGALYRLGKFTRRHRWGVAAALAFLLLLAGYAVTITLQSRRIASALDRARLETQKAALEARRAEQVTSFLIGLFEDSDPRVSPDKPLTARDLLDRGADRATGLGNQPQVQARVFAVVGDVYRTLGEFDQASEALTRSLEIRRSIHGPTDLEVAQSLDLLGTLALDRRQLPRADSLFRQALEIKRTLLGERSLAVAESYGQLASAAPPDLEAAEDYLERALALDEALLGPKHPRVGDVLMKQGTIARWMGRHERAEAAIRRALAIYRQALPPDDPLIARALLHLGDQLVAQGGSAEEAEALFREALAISGGTSAQRYAVRVWGLHSLAQLFADLDRLPEAESLSREALALQERTLGPDHPSVAGSLERLSKVLVRQSRYAEAERLQRRALAIWDKTVAPNKKPTGTAVANLAAILGVQRKFAEAERLVRDRLATFRAEYGRDDGGFLATLARLDIQRGRYARADSLLRAAREASASLFDDAREPMQDIYSGFVELYEAWGRPDRAAEYRALVVDRPAEPDSLPW